MNCSASSPTDKIRSPDVEQQSHGLKNLVGRSLSPRDEAHQTRTQQGSTAGIRAYDMCIAAFFMAIDVLDMQIDLEASATKQDGLVANRTHKHSE